VVHAFYGGYFARRVTLNFGHTHTQTIIGEFGVGESQEVASGIQAVFGKVSVVM
jgi:hypothetical protein